MKKELSYCLLRHRGVSIDKTMDNLDNCSIIFPVIICNFGVIQNELCAEIDQIWLCISLWKNSKQIWQSWQLRCCPSKSWTQDYEFLTFSLSLKYYFAVQLRRDGSWDQLNFIFTCLTRAIYIEIAHFSDANSGLLATESFSARRELIQFFDINFFGAKNEFPKCINFHDLFWIDTSKIQKNF